MFKVTCFLFVMASSFVVILTARPPRSFEEITLPPVDGLPPITLPHITLPPDDEKSFITEDESRLSRENEDGPKKFLLGAAGKSFAVGGMQKASAALVSGEKCDKPPCYEFCSLPYVTGTCRASMKRYYYNIRTKRCQVFIYGGCGGNQNNFKTRKECLDKCTKPHDRRMKFLMGASSKSFVAAGKEKSFAMAVSGKRPKSKCEREREEAIKRQQNGANGVFIPDCEEDGSYKPRQCHGSTGYCWCVDKNGNQIVEPVPPGSILICPPDERPKTKCEKERDEAGPPMPGRYIPQCKEDGSYEPRQCHGSTGYCWCVDKNGNQIVEPVPPGSILICPPVTTSIPLTRPTYL